ncbi:MAG: class I poly(R)-hydroxyalkanoic acid synthase [Rhodobacterales bacterium]|nr:class I poly(R)-hydroxyalkanoic acid synthase [Rhodobacterales bacterium]
MADQHGTEPQIPDPSELSKSMAEIAEKSQRLVTDFLARQKGGMNIGTADPLNVGSAFLEMTTRMMTDPARLATAQMNLWKDYLSLWQNTAARMMGGEPANLIEPERDDRRFKDDAWQENELFNFIKQSYLLTSRWLQTTVNDVDGLDDRTAKKVDFYTKQFVDAVSPTNFVMTNPEVLRATVETRGENLVNGLKNLLEDLEAGNGQLRIKMTDVEAFKVGENIATTPGKVIYRNDMMELIQFTPTTDKVHKTPLLVIPPWINKFYIMDLRPKNSFLKWAVDQGHTVFCMSWVNPDEKHAQKGFTDYMLDGPVKAMDLVQEATGVEGVNMLGYCLGGTLLACTLAYLKAKGDTRCKSATYFTTMLDFSKPGDLGIFTDEETVSSLEEKMAERGYLEGSEMAGTFNMMRANDLIWSFVVNNYLLGKDPFPFDLLFWNSDSTRMPAAMHSYYLRKFYMENKLKDPGGITLDGVPIDLRTIETPSYMISAREDHIAPWDSTYAGTQLFSGPVRFVLAASGHIAGVINPPAANKYCHWINDHKVDRQPADPQDWLKESSQHDGSWWTDWGKWVRKFAGPKTTEPRQPEDSGFEILCDAPGEYVRTRV